MFFLFFFFFSFSGEEVVLTAKTPGNFSRLMLLAISFCSRRTSIRQEYKTEETVIRLRYLCTYQLFLS